ncbi:unnamed protein product [Cyclocybe aegerita]|uniref:Uncharacterized protein n=1 Tax=Cyclocybe aegerita TaxID=1973307 RepID=A0A8S0W026_CYCAE|nr:unnamed protein product [Cyclocybe aegerita]
MAQLLEDPLSQTATSTQPNKSYSASTNTLNEKAVGDSRPSTPDNRSYAEKQTQHNASATGSSREPLMRLANTTIILCAPDGMRTRYVNDNTVICDLGPQGSIDLKAIMSASATASDIFEAVDSPEGLTIHPLAEGTNTHSSREDQDPKSRRDSSTATFVMGSVGQGKEDEDTSDDELVEEYISPGGRFKVKVLASRSCQPDSQEILYQDNDSTEHLFLKLCIFLAICAVFCTALGI